MVHWSKLAWLLVRSENEVKVVTDETTKLEGSALRRMPDPMVSGGLGDFRIRRKKTSLRDCFNDLRGAWRGLAAIVETARGLGN